MPGAVIPLLIITPGNPARGFFDLKTANLAESSIDICPGSEPGTRNSQDTERVSCLHKQSTPDDLDIRLELLTLAAERGDADAQYTPGIMYARGDGVTRDYETAFHRISLAAEQANADAQYALAFIYYGDGVSRDYARAYRWFDIAGSQGRYSAIDYRNSIQRHITPAELLRAQELTRQCIAKKFKGC